MLALPRPFVFEVFHNFVALSQWGNTLYNIMLKLATDTGDPETRDWFKKTMKGSPDDAAGKAFTPLERFVMELFRTITPNGGSISALREVRTPPYQRHGYVITPHEATSFDPVHWENPTTFDPDRYNAAPTSQEIDEAKCEQIGFAKCPFSSEPFEVKDGRKAAIDNSGFGTVFGVVDGKPLPVCDYAGFAPFGVGYRRCPGEQLTIQVFEDFLRKVWKSGIAFHKLDIANPEPFPSVPPRSSPTTSASAELSSLVNPPSQTRSRYEARSRLDRITGRLTLRHGPASRHHRGVRRRGLYARRGQLPALPRDPPSANRSASENLDGAYVRWLARRLRCAECGGPLLSVKPWRQTDASGRAWRRG